MDKLSRIQLLRWRILPHTRQEWREGAAEFKRRAMIANYEYCMEKAREA